jgi:hypothetical protein
LNDPPPDCATIACQNQKYGLHIFLLAESIRAWPAAGKEKWRLFETFRLQPAREPEGRKIFYFFARNPLKSPDSEK